MSFFPTIVGAILLLVPFASILSGVLVSPVSLSENPKSNVYLLGVTMVRIFKISATKEVTFSKTALQQRLLARPWVQRIQNTIPYFYFAITRVHFAVCLQCCVEKAAYVDDSF